MLTSALNQITPWVVDTATLILVGTILALGKRTMTWLGQRIGSEELIQHGQELENDAKVRAYLNEGLKNAISYGLKQHGRGVAGSVIGTAAEGGVVSAAATYAQERMDGALDHFEIDAVGLRKLIVARLPGPEKP